MRESLFWSKVPIVRAKRKGEAKRLEATHKGKILHAYDPVIVDIFDQVRRKKPESPVEMIDSLGQDTMDIDDDDNMTGDDDYGNIMVEDGVGNSRTSSCDDEAKKILNMSRYSFHPFVNNEKSLMEIGKERLGDLQSKRKKNRQKVMLLKDAVRGAHKEKLEKENRVQERLDEYLSDTNVETNADSIPSWLQKMRRE